MQRRAKGHWNDGHRGRKSEATQETVKAILGMETEKCLEGVKER